jgi:hypothetical protein
MKNAYSYGSLRLLIFHLNKADIEYLFSPLDSVVWYGPYSNLRM